MTEENFPFRETVPFQAAHIGESSGRDQLILALDWSALQPEPKRWDEDLIALIRKNLTEMINRRQRPILILQMYRTPIWFEKEGGWGNKRAAELFEPYAERMAQEFGGLVKDWIPIYAAHRLAERSTLKGTFPPKKRGGGRAFAAVCAGLASAYLSAVGAIRKQVSDPSVGLHFCGETFGKWNDDFFQGLLAGNFRSGFFHRSFEPIECPFDFIGIDLEDHSDSLRILQGGITTFVKNFITLSERYSVPIRITNERVFSTSDRNRASLRAAHLFGIWQSWNLGVPIQSCAFPLFDLFNGSFSKDELLCASFLQKKALDTEDLKILAPDFRKYLYH